MVLVVVRISSCVYMSVYSARNTDADSCLSLSLSLSLSLCVCVCVCVSVRSVVFFQHIYTHVTQRKECMPVGVDDHIHERGIL